MAGGLTTLGIDVRLLSIPKDIGELSNLLREGISGLIALGPMPLNIKVKAMGAIRAEIKRTADIFRGQIVDVTSTTYTIQLAGTSDKLDAFIEALSETTILEVVRSGVSGTARGEKVLSI